MRKLDLRTGKPVWLSYRTGKTPEQTLSSDVSTEVLIVGMGISGAMAADLLTEAGHGVVLVDRRGVSEGSTPATTALVQFEIDVPLSDLRLKIGVDRATRAWRRARLAVGNLQDRIEELGVRCRMRRRPTLYLAGNRLAGTALRKEAEMRAAAGLSARYLPASQLRSGFGIDRAGAILSHGNLALDPVKLSSALLARARERGARLYAPEEAVELHNGRDAVRIRMRSGHEITARTVVLATGYELLDPVKDDRHQIISTWAIATGRQRANAMWPGGALIWEASDPYLYLRTTHDRRVICGGEDGEFADEARRPVGQEDRPHRREAGKAAPRHRPDARIRMGRQLRNHDHRPAPDRPRAGKAAAVRPHGLRRQRDHLFPHRGGDSSHASRRRAGRRRRHLRSLTPRKPIPAIRDRSDPPSFIAGLLHTGYASRRGEAFPRYAC